MGKGERDGRGLEGEGKSGLERGWVREGRGNHEGEGGWKRG